MVLVSDETLSSNGVLNFFVPNRSKSLFQKKDFNLVTDSSTASSDEEDASSTDTGGPDSELSQREAVSHTNPHKDVTKPTVMTQQTKQRSESDSGLYFPVFAFVFALAAS